jgi:bifunctional non-homologous end joining protein LigD
MAQSGGRLPRIGAMLATPGQLPSAATDGKFGYEVKWDGIRAVAYVSGGEVHLISRNDRDITTAYPELIPPPAALSGHAAVLDGEIVAFDPDGKPSFASLQTRMHLRDPGPIARQRDSNPVNYVVFDLMYLDGHDLTDQTYQSRREILQSIGLGGEADAAWTCPDHQSGHGADLFDATLRLGLEGVIAKRLDSRYAQRRSPDWIKVKHVRTQEVVIGGWTPGEGRRSETLGALLLGIPHRDGLGFVGHVGTGFTDRALTDLRARLDDVAADHSPFSSGLPDSAAAARWVRPEIVGEVVHTGLTPAGMLRTPSWRGLRPDKAPRQVRI